MPTTQKGHIVVRGLLTSFRDFDPSGPVGPNAFWKIVDRSPTTDDRTVTIQDFLPIVDGYEDDFEHEPTHEELTQTWPSSIQVFHVGD